MALELIGSVFSVLRKIHQIATQAKANLDALRTELDANDIAIKQVLDAMNSPAMARCLLEHHPEQNDQFVKQIKEAKRSQMKTRKKFKPLYQQFEALMGKLLKMNLASEVIMKTARIFMLAASKMVEMIAGKAQAFLQKQAMLKDAASEAHASVTEASQKSITAIRDVSEHQGC